MIMSCMVTWSTHKHWCIIIIFIRAVETEVSTPFFCPPGHRYAVALVLLPFAPWGEGGEEGVKLERWECGMGENAGGLSEVLSFAQSLCSTKVRDQHRLRYYYRLIPRLNGSGMWTRLDKPASAYPSVCSGGRHWLLQAPPSRPNKWVNDRGTPITESIHNSYAYRLFMQCGSLVQAYFWMVGKYTLQRNK